MCVRMQIDAGIKGRQKIREAQISPITNPSKLPDTIARAPSTRLYQTAN